MPLAAAVGTTGQFVEIKLGGYSLGNSGVYQSLTNLFHYYSGTTISQTNANKQLIATAWVGQCWTSALQNALNSHTMYGYVPTVLGVRFFDVPTDSFNVNTLPSAATGPTGDPLPLDNSVTIQKISGFRGRRAGGYRGSWHFGPVSESDTLDNELANVSPNTGLTTWTTVHTALLANLSPTGLPTLTPIIFGRKGSQVRTAPCTINYQTIVSLTLDKIIGRMKKRQEKARARNPTYTPYVV